MILIFSLFLGCTNQIELAYATETCVDWDFSNEAPELRIERVGDDVVIQRVGISGLCGDQFQPEILANGWDIRVTENWDYSDATDCESCLSARVTMVSPPKGDYHIEWFPDSEVISPVHDEYFIVD